MYPQQIIETVIPKQDESPREAISQTVDSAACAPAGIAAMIPALNPPWEFVEYVRELRDAGFLPVVVIDDGSDPGMAEIFAEIQRIPGCEVLRHAVNLGKGRALKTGLNHLLLHHPELRGVVTADADGQHRAVDAVLVARTLVGHPGKLVVGSRDFTECVPWKSMVGNLLTRWLFAFLVGQRVSDTQSGLRGIPSSAFPEMLRLAGERYEYEMNVLASAPDSALEIVEQPIHTIYIDGNRGSHFNPVLDSMRVGFVLLRFYFSSLIASALDLVLFAFLLGETSNLLLSLMTSRAVVGPLVNFGLNNKFVFQNRSSWMGPLLKYYLLAGFSGLVSFALIRALDGITGWNVLICKVAVEVPLSLFNFAVQRMFVFRHAAENDRG